MRTPATICVIAAAVVVGCGKPQLSKSDASPLGTVVSSLVQPGDLVFRSGKGRWSAYFRDMSLRERRFSHVGVVATNESGAIVVVHASADDTTGIGAVTAEPVITFLGVHDDVAVFRVLAEQKSRQAIAAVCISKIGTRFDARFDLSDSKELYCTELVRLAVNSTMGKQLVSTTTVKGREIVAVDDCYLGTWTDKVYDSRENAEPSGGEVRLSAARPAAPHR